MAMDAMTFGSAFTHYDKANVNLQKLLNRLIASSQPLLDCRVNIMDTPYWSESTWHYQALTRWDSIDAASQFCVLQTSAHDKLCELYLYAQAAMAACGRLFWLSEDPLQRQIYALLMADYSTHQMNLKSILPIDLSEANDFSFGHFLARNIENGAYASLVILFLLILPTLIYQRLQLLIPSCQSYEVKHVLEKFGKDLLRHRYCGRVLHRQAPVTQRNIQFLQNQLTDFRNILQAVPFYSLTPIATVLGGLHAQDISDYSPYFYDKLTEQLQLVHTLLRQNNLESLCAYFIVDQCKLPNLKLATDSAEVSWEKSCPPQPFLCVSDELSATETLIPTTI
jgi:hypothetical protein